MNKILGADAYFGIKIRKADATFQDLSVYENISLALRFSDGSAIVGRVVPDPEVEDELTIETQSSTLYYLIVPRALTEDKPAGIGYAELSILAGDDWKTISQPAELRWVKPKTTVV
ncbi:MAG: hypothetical protein HC896_11670 [Bacteroidales bacterium]|nr:hypothetical protein [Bacteroidales bacterium]